MLTLPEKRVDFLHVFALCLPYLVAAVVSQTSLAICFVWASSSEQYMATKNSKTRGSAKGIAA